MNSDSSSERTTVFISKSTPGDDAFALWLAPRLEAEGYEVFADILCLDAGDRWRQKLTGALQNNAVKMLLCCSDATLSKAGVLEEIEIADDLIKELGDKNFLIPLRIKPYKKVFGIGGLQWVDFSKGWAEGLSVLLKELKKLDVPRLGKPKINPAWAAYQRRKLYDLRNAPEILTSNWLRILEAPDNLHFLVPKGAVSKDAVKSALSDFSYPYVGFRDGIITFASPLDLADLSSRVGSFEASESIPFERFRDDGWSEFSIESADARRMLTSIMRQAWERHCSAAGFTTYEFSNSLAHIACDSQIGLGKRVAWGKQGARRNSMLRNKAKGRVWEFGVSAQPSLFPFPHFRLKPRVLFSDIDSGSKIQMIQDHRTQHRLRRSVCSAWRNKAWHGRIMAFIELLAGESPYVALPVGGGQHILLDASPVMVTSPVTARQTNYMDEEAEETDPTLLAGPPQEDDE